MEEELLKYAIDNGMIDLSYVQEQIEMNKRNELLKKHPYKIWEGKDGKWRTYLPDEEKGRILKKRSTENAIKDMIVEYYLQVSKEQAKNSKEESDENLFDACFESWKKKQIAYGISGNTVYKYEYDYKRFFTGTDFEKLDVRNVTEEDITIFIISRIRELNLKEKAGKALWGYISGVFRSLRINKRITDDPCKYVDTKSFFKFYNKEVKAQSDRVLSDVETEMIMERIALDHKEKSWYMPSYAVELAIYTGMRAGELAGLKWENVFINERIIVISKSEKYNGVSKEYYLSSTKTYKSREFPISDEIMRLFIRIRKIQEEYGCYEGFVFSTSDGQVHCRTISDCMRNKCIQIGMKHTKGMNAVRRTVNSRMRCAGVSATVAASLLGHTEEVNQKNYTYDITHMDYKREVVDKINENLKGNQGNQNNYKKKMAEILDFTRLSANLKTAGDGT